MSKWSAEKELLITKYACSEELKPNLRGKFTCGGLLASSLQAIFQSNQLLVETNLC